ncbi:MAG: HAMP domain-containing protein [Alphaproteobacteria bacterium]|nr:HAMP domain-containing protein [Alphaproteobacteria bacterium]
MSVEAERRPGEVSAPPAVRAGRISLAARTRKFRRAIRASLSSPLTRRILLLNLGGLAALLVGFLYLNQLREGLIDARMQSLQVQGEIIAAAVASSAQVETDTITVDPDKLLQLQPGESYGGREDGESALDFSINPERVGPVLRRLVSPTNTRARVYDRDGYLLVDSLSITDRSTILSFDLPAPNIQPARSNAISSWWRSFRNRLTSPRLPLYEDIGIANGRTYSEVGSALSGAAQSIVRANARGETIISVAVPVQRFRVVRGALLLSTQGGDIDKIISSERRSLFRIFLVYAVIMSVLSLLLAGAIAEPIRRLAEAADRVRRGTGSREEIPDFTARTDEIGHLSGALRDMTQALYNRIEAIERFAADVAHELKNPLTSLRSAVETLPIAKTDAARERLLEVIQHDVKRLDRLITDISDASRLDAELARGDDEPVDLVKLLSAVTRMANQAQRDDRVTVTLDVAPAGSGHYVVMGHDSRLGQVITNLIENARSFSPEGGNVRIALRRAARMQGAGAGKPGIEIIIDDDGPGIPAHAFERIFERFYTDRPNQGFGQNSGLGLSISRQIVEAHRGFITAQNRPGAEEGGTGGARFTVWLPAAA